MLEASTSLAFTRRAICHLCSRPATTCICSSLPNSPIQLKGHIIVFRHKHELKKPLATIPTLQLCLKNYIRVVHSGGGKRILAKGTRGKEADEAFELIANTGKRIFALFPGPGAVPLDSLLPHLAKTPAGEEEGAQDPSPAPFSKDTDNDDGWLLVAIDVTWREAREMWASIKTELLPPKEKAVQVILPPPPTLGPGNEEEGEGLTSMGACLIRKEPVEGFLTTYEAICKAIVILEGSEGREGLEEVLLKPLRRMTEHQANLDPAVASRCPWALGDAENQDEAPSAKKLRAGYHHREGGRLNPAPQ